ncbi:metalloreductase STEAP4-like [Homarus americanus]|uniref:metalloreductase STEAP4-like n=1 Tax=Homarus americanus TaxID=6706 RepID=UPI001C497283|nr:metalloreductase STEAP4-like [Homarus americanus]
MSVQGQKSTEGRVWSTQHHRIHPSADTILHHNQGMDNMSFGTDGSDPLGVNGTANGLSSDGKRKAPQDPDKVIAVLGSGDYGRAISRRMVNSGVTVYIGSRDPNRSKIKNLVRQTGAVLAAQEVALAAAKMVVVAVGRDHYDYLPITNLRGKILIDVSNNTERRRGPHYRSNAEYLQGLVPEAKVVKGFNVLSAYALENGGLQGSKEVFLASDHIDAKAKVSDLVRMMGFHPVDWGSLQASRDIEDVPLHLMPSWKRPVAVVFGVFLFLWLLALFSFQICPNIASGEWTEKWSHIAMKNFNRVLAITAIWILSFCYIPGLIASYIQLWRGTKYSRFPKWLDDWLKMRKQLGLLMLGLASLHACISVAYVTPQTTSWVYEDPVKVQAQVIVDENTTTTDTITIYNDEFNWRGELFLTMGAIAMCLTIVLGISSLPSVTATLSWREFTFIQSKLGWVALICAAAHDIFLAWQFMFLYWGCFRTLPIGPQYALYPPFIAVIMKIPLLLPPVDNYLQKIRKGYERGSQYEVRKSEVA